MNGRAKAAQAYPQALCRAVCKGLIEQMEMDQMGQFMIAEINADGKGNSQELKKEAESIQQQYKTIEEDNDAQMESAWDDVSGAELDPL